MPSGIYTRNKPSWNKGLKMPPEYGEARRHSFLGRTHTEGAKRKVPEANKNHPVTDDMRQKMSEKAKLRVGEDAPNWQGGITQETKKGRGCKAYKDWQFAVFKRDNFKCIRCGSGSQLEADHVQDWVEYPELRYEVSNGRTLCHPCHKVMTTLKRLLVYLEYEVERGQKDRIDYYKHRISVLLKLNAPEIIREGKEYKSYWIDKTTRYLPRRIKTRAEMTLDKQIDKQLELAMGQSGRLRDEHPPRS